MFHTGPARKALFKPVWHIPVPNVQWINSWLWAEELSETCRVSCQNKSGKLVRLVGFIIKKSCNSHLVIIYDTDIFIWAWERWSDRVVEKTTQRGALLSILTKYYLGYKIGKNKLRGGGCIWHVWRTDVHKGFWWGYLRERDHLEDIEVDGRIILKWIFKKWVAGVDWTDLAQDWDRWWWALVIGVMNLRVP